MRVLYVDDEPDIREIARMALELDPGFVVQVAASGADALAVAPTFSPNIILLDVMMPDIDGPATLAALQRDFGSSLAPVIFVTARTQAAEIDRLRSLGAMAVIPKPFDAMDFARQVRELASV